MTGPSVRSLAESLRATLRALGISRGVARARALEAWPVVAQGLLGADARRTHALRIDGETLVVAVPSPVLAQELRLHAERLIAELARQAPEAEVRAVRFVPR